MIKITVLNDNRNDKCELENEHGFSIYIEVDKYKLLLDSGQSDIFVKNADKLDIDLDKLDAIILSHGHYDHGNGLKYIRKKTKLIMHPLCVSNRVSKRTGNYGGINQSLEELEEKFELIQSVDSYEIFDDIYFLGQIERKNDYEAKTFPMIVDNGQDDIALDDTGCAIKTKEGIIVISGCAHSGICNTVEHAKKVTGENRILAVMGGFHLKAVDESCMQTIKYLKENNVQYIYLGHCTSDAVCDEFIKCMGDKVKVMKVGDSYKVSYDKKR